MTRISDNMENTSSSPTHDEPQEQIEVKSDQPHGLSTPIPAVHSLCPETSPLSATYTSIVVPELINSTSWKGIQKQSPMKLTNLPTATPTSFQWENIFNKCDHSNPQSPYSNSGQLEGDHFTGAIAYGNSAYVPPTFSKISVQRDTEDIPHSKLINGINSQFRCPNLSVKSAGYQQSINSDRWDGVYKNLEKPTICQSSRSPVVGQNLATHTGADSDQGCLFQPDMSIGNTMNGNTMYYPGSTPTGTPMPNTFCPLVPPTVGYTTPAFLNDDIFNEEQEHPNLLPYPAWNTNGMNFRTHNSHGVELSTSRRRNATRESTATLKSWLQEHIKNPYPTKGEKIMLAIITKMTLTQVSTWFANARRRLKKENKMTWTPKHRNEELQEDDDEDIDAEMSDSGENLPTGKSADSKEPTLRGSDRQNFLNGDLEECSTDISYSVSSCSKSSGDGKLGQTIPMSEDIGKVFYPYHRYEAQHNQPASPRTEHTSESPTSKRTFQSLVDSSGTESTRNMYRNDQFSSLQSIAKANSQIPGYNNLSENEKRNSMDETSPALWMPYTSDFVPSQSKMSSFDVERTIKWSTSFMEQTTEDRGPLLKTDSLQSDIGIFGPIPHPDFTCAYPTLRFSNDNTSSRLSQITPQSVSIPPPWVWRHNPQPFIIPSSTANDVNKLVEPASSERLSPWRSSGGNQFRLSPQAAINEFHRPNWENVLHSKEGMAALKTLPQNDSRRPEDNSRLNFLNDTYSLDLLHQNGVKTPEPTASSLTTLQTFSPFHPYAEASFPLPSQI